MSDFCIPPEFDFGQQFDRRTLSAAMELQPESALLDLQVDGSVLRTRMRGAGVLAYAQIIELPVDRRLGLKVKGQCSCPVGFNCKHVAAALMACEARQIRQAKQGGPLALDGRASADTPVAAAASASASAPSVLPATAAGDALTLRQRPGPLPTELATWLVRLHDVAAPADSSQRRVPNAKQLMYVLWTDGALLRLQLRLGSLRRSGEVGTHRPHKPTPMEMLRSAPGYVDAADQRLLAALLPLADSIDPDVVVLRGRGAAAALRQVIESGRAWLAPGGAVDALPTPPGPPLHWLATPAALRPTWTPDARGQWRLLWRAAAEPEGQAAQDPTPAGLFQCVSLPEPHAVSAANNTVQPAIVEGMDFTPSVADWLGKMPVVPADAMPQLAQRLQAAAEARQMVLPLPPLQARSVEDAGALPLQAVLRLSTCPDVASEYLLSHGGAGHAGMRLGWSRPRVDTSARQPAAQLVLRYAPPGAAVLDFHFPCGAAPVTFVERGSAGVGMLRFERDPDAEAEAVRLFFTVLQLRPWSQVAGLALERLTALTTGRAQAAALPAALEGRPITAVPHQRNAWPLLLAQGVPELQRLGWHIDQADDFPFELQEADDWELRIDDEAGQRGGEWFSVGLKVQVDGEPVDLLPLLVGLVQSGWLHIDAAARQTEGDVLLPWPGTSTAASAASAAGAERQRLLRLPAQRVAPLLDWLRRVFRIDGRPPESDAALRMSRHDLATLDAVSVGARVVAAPSYTELLDQVRALHDGRGLPPVAPSPHLQAVLRPYQCDGLAWMDFLRRARFGGVLADDMGLGKTLQALALLQNELDCGRLDRPSLVVVPTSLVGNWQTEAARFAPQLKVLVLHGAKRSQLFSRMADAHLVVTTYPLAVRDAEALGAQPWHYLMLDEAQRIKNSRSLATLALKGLGARHRLALSGTPLENHLGELWSLMDFVSSGLLGSEAQFRAYYRNPIERRQDTAMAQQLARRVRPFLLRRTKQQVATELPPKTETLLRVELAGAQADLYETVRATMDKKLREAIAKQGLARSRIMVLDALLKLRQVCCDPRLLKHAADDPAADRPAEAAPHRHARSAKLDLLLDLLPTLIEDGRRVLLFSQFTEMLALIEPELDKLALPYLKLTGETQQRGALVDKFQAGAVPLFLISLKAGGIGLNLTAADTVILYDPWWNPAVEQQAIDRAYRIGQDKPVFVYKLLATGTVEEKMLELQTRKAGLADTLLAGVASDAAFTAQDFDELLRPMG